MPALRRPSTAVLRLTATETRALGRFNRHGLRLSGMTVDPSAVPEVRAVIAEEITSRRPRSG